MNIATKAGVLDTGKEFQMENLLSKGVTTAEIRRQLREMAKASFFFFAKFVCGNKDMLPIAEFPDHTLHKDMCEFLTNPKLKRKMILVPRGSLKSTIGTVAYPLWRIVNNPNIRILIASSKAELSEKFVRNIQEIILKGPFFKELFPEFVPSEDWRKKNIWNAGAFIIPGRTKVLRDPTVEACGVGGSRAGVHVDLIIKDDLVADNAARSEAVMADVINWHMLSDPLFDNPEHGEDIIIGTRWHFRDLYSHILKTDKRYKLFHRGCFDEKGEPIFPNKFSKKGLMDLRETLGSYIFSCQYLCNPTDPEHQDFKEEDIRYFYLDDNKHIISEYNQTRKLDPRFMDVVMCVDPAISEKKQDCDSAIVVAAYSAEGNIYLLECLGIKVTPKELLKKIFDVRRKWNPRKVVIEAVGYQKALIYHVKDIQRETGDYFTIEAIHPGHADKDSRIRGLQPYFEGKRIHILREHTKLLEQVSSFPLGKDRDLLDALAYAPKVWRRPDSDDYLDDEEKEEGEFWNPFYSGNRNETTGY